MSKDSYYFSHDSNAFMDPKILKLRMEFGWEGYGLFWGIIESLRNQKDYTFTTEEVEYLTLSLAIDLAKLKQVLSKCYELGLLVHSEGKIYSESLLRRMEIADKIREKRRKAGSKGGKARAKLKQNSSEAQALKETKGKEKKLKKLEKDLKAQESFKDFWELYPRKINKQKADSNWKKIDELEHVAILAALRVYQFSEEEQYIPHPATWLSQKRWEDQQGTSKEAPDILSDEAELKRHEENLRQDKLDRGEM
jgi:hypothetical protein|tara:strand:+ start:2308 stop:3063 length:756 start_codon:yes stop_codon:yes gene_type:complete